MDNGKVRLVGGLGTGRADTDRGIPALCSTSSTPDGLLYARSLIVATTPSSTILRAQSTSPFASPFVSQTTACIRVPFVPSPPRLLNAATAALKASPWSGLAAVGDVIGAIIPTLTTGPDAACPRRRPRSGHEDDSAALATASTASRRGLASDSHGASPGVTCLRAVR